MNPLLNKTIKVTGNSEWTDEFGQEVSDELNTLFWKHFDAFKREARAITGDLEVEALCPSYS